MYASKTPCDLNHDPYPWRVVLGAWANTRCAVHLPESEHDPRPEFDHHQHNNPNPILLEFRRNYTGGRHDWLTLFLDRLTPGDGFYVRSREHPPQQIDHARRVLTRLARF